MTKKKIFAPATKEDLVRLGQSMKADLDEAVVSLRRDLDSRAEMASGHNRLALQIERQQNEVRASEGRNSQVVDRLEFFTGRMETLWRESKTLPQVIDAQGRMELF